jgi:hypothetical protein
MPADAASATIATEEDTWKMTEEGPIISESLSDILGLSVQQQEAVNDALQTNYQSYLETERKHVKFERMDNQHYCVRLTAFPEAFADHEHALWSTLDEILDSRQQALARQKLPLGPGSGARPGNPQPAGAFARAGVLGWGGQEAQFDLRQIGQWYRWEIMVGPAKRSGTGTDFPLSLQRFWNQRLGQPQRMSPPRVE